MPDIPIIRTELSSDGKRQVFFCRYCRKRHYHGLGAGRFEAQENCHYKTTGYWLTNGKESYVS